MKSLTSRTTLITAAAVAGVLIAGTAAIAANVGILNASNDSSIGSLSATDDLVPTTTLDPGAPMVLEIADPASATDRTQEPTTTVAGGASYAVDEAGTVSVSMTATPGVLTLVEAADQPDWTHTATQPDPLSLRVEFTNGTRTVIFTATLNANGTITADVTEPVIVVGAAPNSPVAAPMSPSDDDQYEGDDDDQYETESDDDEYESDDESDDDEYESDDGEHEYEGADDDD